MTLEELERIEKSAYPHTQYVCEPRPSCPRRSPCTGSGTAL